MRSLIALAATASLVSCSHEIPPDRHQGPEAAVAAARYALHQRDLPAYFEALSDSAVRETLSNSIGICSISSDPMAAKVMREAGHNPAVGCDAVLQKYGWIPPKATSPEQMPQAFQEAVRQIRNPRAMAAELETNYRENGAGTSFVWEWLDDAKVQDLKIQGATATGAVRLTGDPIPATFERDSTGWRFALHFDAAE